MFKIVSFNVNGIRARLHQIEAIQLAHYPDVLALQECKVVDEQFPLEWTQQLGFHTAIHGQKGHYGVALLSQTAPLQIAKGFAHDAIDAQRRLIIGRYSLPRGGELTVINGYFPQGEERDHPLKFPAKQRFYADLLAHLQMNHSPDQLLAVVGDLNVAPLENDIGIGDVNAKRWRRTGKCGFLPEEREWFNRLLEWGLIDAYRAIHPDVSDQFSWFDYRSRGFEDQPRRGLRIDHILMTAPLAAQLREVGIDTAIRGMDKPSDHCPVWASFEL
ncbi:exodeoxyribonuclease III [Chromatium okenii]|uniref:Exodeoxyribonuclease III n=2 Tax=Chromatium okenii TaxID=61644 RepID=A0A2S7XQ20_9GAMM|nr:exodeoxyribonuclease III [Chromatium okenii]PQJ95481.1 exodeoxyribonuclease III [Chromatium okenii]